ncbi:BamA/TamA family outer membrane protein [Pseudomonadota bacterium]
MFFNQIGKALPTAIIWSFLLLNSTLCWGQAPIISEIRLTGNERTKPKIILIHTGDPVDTGKIELSRQAIMDLGLFKSVTTRLIKEGDNTVLEIEISEKYYIIPLPRLDRSADGEVSYGGQIRLDNLGGLNQKLKLTYKAQRGCCDTDRTVNTFSMGYSYPRVAGTHYGLSVGLSHSVTPQANQATLGTAVSEYQEELDSVSVGLWRWLIRDGPSEGWSIGVSTFWQQLHYSQHSGAPITFSSEKSAGVATGLRYNKVHDMLFSRRGMEMGIISEQGLEAHGSDSSFSRSQFYYRRYYPVSNTPHTSLNVQMRLGGSGGKMPIIDHPYGLGGSRDLRGYTKGSLTGRSYFLSNVELLRPLWGHNAGRGVLFWDVGNAYADNRLIDFDDLESSAGIGYRYKLKSFVNFQLRMDIAYAFGLSKNKFYFGSKNTF